MNKDELPKHHAFTHFHKALGVLVLILYAYVWLNLYELSPEMVNTLDDSRNGVSFTIYTTPLLGIACFLAPHWMSKNFSPRTESLGTRFFGPGAFILFGYINLLISAFVYAPALSALIDK